MDAKIKDVTVQAVVQFSLTFRSKVASVPTRINGTQQLEQMMDKSHCSFIRGQHREVDTDNERKRQQR